MFAKNTFLIVFKNNFNKISFSGHVIRHEPPTTNIHIQISFNDLIDKYNVFLLLMLNISCRYFGKSICKLSSQRSLKSNNYDILIGVTIHYNLIRLCNIVYSGFTINITQKRTWRAVHLHLVDTLS